MKREENDLMRANILDAAIACSIEAAGDDVFLFQISCRAGISERTLNRYFPDKEMLQYGAAIRYLRNLYTSFAERYRAAEKSGMNGLQSLLLMLQLQIERNKSDPIGAKVFVRAYTAALRTAVYRDLPVAGYDAPVREIVFRCIEDGIRDGSIRRDIVPLDTYLLISSTYMGLVQRLIYICSVDLPQDEHREKLLLVFNKSLQMLEKYLQAD